MNDYDIDASLAGLGDLVDIEIGRREKRPLCVRCCRPVGVCWCKSVDSSRIEVRSRIILLQHPHEEKRCLRTAPILETLLPEGHFLELKGKKFTTKRFPQLQDILQSENTIVLYPGKEAKPIDNLPPVSSDQPPYNIILLDGTWQQTKSMYFRNICLRGLKQVCLSGNHNSQYVIRTQPSEEALSTVETAAITLSTVEDDWTIYERLIHPLKVMCDFQMNHGAVKHESKEQLILSGRYKKPLGKRTYRKLRKCGVKNANITMKEILDIAERQNQKEQEERLLSINDKSGCEVAVDEDRNWKGKITLNEITVEDVGEGEVTSSNLNNFYNLQIQDSNSDLDLFVDVER